MLYKNPKGGSPGSLKFFISIVKKSGVIVRVPPFSSTFLIYLVFSLVPTFSRKICDQWISKSQRRGRQVKAGRLGMVWCAFKGPQGPQGPQGPGYLEQCGGRTPQPVVTTCWSPCQVLKVHVGAVETIIFGPKEFRFGVVIECVLGSERGWKKKGFDCLYFVMSNSFGSPIFHRIRPWKFIWVKFAAQPSACDW